MMKRTITRRTVAAQLGVLAGGASLLGPGFARAVIVTPRQAEGPFYPPPPHAETDTDLTMLGGHDTPAAGEVILVRGRVTDTRGNALPRVRVDIWQANHWGRYAHPRDPNTAPLDPNFQGMGISHTDDDGYYGFKTIRPAPYPLDALGGTAWRARHIHFKLADAAGRRLTTQMYFRGDPLLADDGVFNSTPQAERQTLLTAAVADDATGFPVHTFDITLADAVG